MNPQQNRDRVTMSEEASKLTNVLSKLYQAVIYLEERRQGKERVRTEEFTLGEDWSPEHLRAKFVEGFEKIPALWDRYLGLWEQKPVAVAATGQSVPKPVAQAPKVEAVVPPRPTPRTTQVNVVERIPAGGEPSLPRSPINPTAATPRRLRTLKTDPSVLAAQLEGETPPLTEEEQEN